MFKDSPAGQTHSYNDGCGEPAHNTSIPKLIKHPVTFKIGKIFDADGHHILDIRGWGRLQYLPNPEIKQDAIGQFVADAINEKLTTLGEE